MADSATKGATYTTTSNPFTALAFRNLQVNFLNCRLGSAEDCPYFKERSHEYDDGDRYRSMDEAKGRLKSSDAIYVSSWRAVQEKRVYQLTFRFPLHTKRDPR